MGIFSGETNLIGLDIGTSGLRLVELKHAAGKPKLVTFGALAVDPKVMQSDAPIDQQQVQAAIKKLLDESKVTTKNIVAGLPTSKVYSSAIDMPKMSEPELEKAISYQAEQYVPVSIDKVKVDWMPVGISPDGSQQEILLVAAPVDLSERYFHMLEGLGLEVVALEPDGLALGRSLVADANTAAVVFDVGASSTDLVAVYQSLPRLIRSIPVGGDTFVKAAAQNLNLDPEQALQFVYKFGMSDAKLDNQVQKAIKPNVDSLVSELDKSIKFFSSRYKDVKLSKVVLTGKASLMPDFPAYIANAVNLPVEIGNAWGRVDYKASIQDKLMQLSSQFSVAAGLALRGMV